MFEKKAITTMQYTIPVYISGEIGANFEDKVEDHYYWFIGINTLLDNNGSDNEIGNISTSTVYHAEIYALEPVVIGDVGDI